MGHQKGAANARLAKLQGRWEAASTPHMLLPEATGSPSEAERGMLTTGPMAAAACSEAGSPAAADKTRERA